ncbi:anti-sigma factor family protein [Bacteroidota bacterium]
MKELTDEILNKYVDDELSTTELNQLKELIAGDEEALKKLKAHKLANQILYKMEIIPAPSKFTDRVMVKIYNIAPKKVKKSFFIPGVISILMMGIIGIFVYIFTTPAQPPDPESKTVSILNDAKEIVAQKVGDFSSFFGNDTILLVGSFLTFVLLLSTYFMINSHKNFKHNLDKFSH